MLDLKEPEGWPRWAIDIALIVMSPYRVSLEAGQRHPLESLRRHMAHTWMRELYFGVVYLAVGEVSEG